MNMSAQNFVVFATSFVAYSPRADFSSNVPTDKPQHASQRSDRTHGEAPSARTWVESEGAGKASGDRCVDTFSHRARWSQRDRQFDASGCIGARCGVHVDVGDAWRSRSHDSALSASERDDAGQRAAEGLIFNSRGRALSIAQYAVYEFVGFTTNLRNLRLCAVRPRQKASERGRTNGSVNLLFNTRDCVEGRPLVPL